MLTVTNESTFIIKSDIVIWHKPWCKYCYQLNMCTDPGSYKFTIRTKRKRTENANETNEKRTNDTKNARYTKRTHDTRNERTIHVTNARYTKRTHDTRNQRTLHERTNHWSVHVAIYYPMTNHPGSIEVQYSIVLLFEWLLCKLTWLTNLIFYTQLIQNGYINDKLVDKVIG